MEYERIRYPDGQISAKWLVEEPTEPIKERINSYEDLIFVRSLAEAYQGKKKLTLFIPCLFGQRSDRRFQKGQSFDLKVIAEVINSCKFGAVTVFDPHSDVAMGLIEHGQSENSYSFVHHVIENPMSIYARDSIVLVAPDAGAFKKVYNYGEMLNVGVVGASKHRDNDGKIDILLTAPVKDKTCLIVDDLIDGGATFTKLASKLKAQGAGRVFLYVSHAYFSKGIDVIMSKEDDHHKEGIDHVFCTNSVKDIKHARVTQYKVI